LTASLLLAALLLWLQRKQKALKPRAIEAEA
jgi:hypothetical protein